MSSGVVRDFSICPRCKAPTQVAKAISGADSEFWYECTQCNTYINTYIPQTHQEAFHRDPHRYRGNFGGYGTGKTTTSREEFYKHLFITPNGNTLIGANITHQYEQTIKRDIEGDLPRDFISNISVQKSFVDFKNGHRLTFRPLDDQGKLRSLNLTLCIIVEASEVNSEIYHQIKTRLRNMAATVPERDEQGEILYNYTTKGVPIPRLKHDWRSCIIESNPDSGWIRTEVLGVSDDIQKHGDVVDQIYVPHAQRDEYTSSHISATNVNQFLPPNFIAENIKNKPAWWIHRYIKGSFSYAEGLVYPRAIETFIEPFEIPKGWKRIIAFDYGLSDDAVYVLGAVDEKEGILYIYKEVRCNNKSVEDLALLYFQSTNDIPSGGIWGQPLIDPKSAPKRDYNKKSLADHFLDYGISFKSGHIDVSARVFRLNTYIESGKIKIFTYCAGLMKELKDYKYPSKKIGQATSDKPQDKNNHGINALEWITMELPADPKNLLYGIYSNRGNLTGDTVGRAEITLETYAGYALMEEGSRGYDEPDTSGMFARPDWL